MEPIGYNVTDGEGQAIAENVSAEDAAKALLGHLDHDYDIRKEGEQWNLYVSLFSRDDASGHNRMVWKWRYSASTKEGVYANVLRYGVRNGAEAEPVYPPVTTPDTLRAWRKRLGLKQHEAANALGLHTDSYNRIERGVRTIDRRTQLACAWVERHGPALPGEQESEES